MRQHHVARQALCLAVLLCLLLSGCKGPQENPLVFLIADHDTGFYWKNIIEGVSLAAKDSGYRVEISILNDGEDLDALLTKGWEEGAVLIALALDPHQLPQAYMGEPPLAILGSDFESSWAVCRVLSEETTIGKRTGQLLAKRIGLQKNILLITTTESYTQGNEWEVALRGEMGIQGSHVSARVFCKDDIDLAYRRSKAILEDNPEINAIVCQSENATTGALRAVRELGLQTPVVGADFNKDIAEGLRSGSVCLTVVRNAYAIGYIGIENALHPQSGKPAAEKKLLDAVYLDEESMLQDAMQVFLFDIQ